MRLDFRRCFRTLTAVVARCILLLEDLDAAFTRSVTRDAASTGTPILTRASGSSRRRTATIPDDSSEGNTLSLSGLLNALDGVAASEGRCVVEYPKSTRTDPNDVTFSPQVIIRNDEPHRTPRPRAFSAWPNGRLDQLQERDKVAGRGHLQMFLPICACACAFTVCDRHRGRCRCQFWHR